jgi:hypothetical protein
VVAGVVAGVVVGADEVVAGDVAVVVPGAVVAGVATGVAGAVVTAADGEAGTVVTGAEGVAGAAGVLAGAVAAGVTGEVGCAVADGVASSVGRLGSVGLGSAVWSGTVGNAAVGVMPAIGPSPLVQALSVAARAAAAARPTTRSLREPIGPSSASAMHIWSVSSVTDLDHVRGGTRQRAGRGRGERGARG